MNLDPFPVGVWQLHADPAFDYQLNRLVTLNRCPLDEVTQAAKRIQSLEDWITAFVELADTASSQGRRADEAAYLRAAEFYTRRADPSKTELYLRQARLWRDAIAFDDLASGAVNEHHINFRDGQIRALDITTDGAAHGTIVFFGGFDSYLEETYDVACKLASNGVRVIFFEGPGQGSVIHEHHLPFTTSWHQPVGAVLDSFEVSDVTLVGMSMGSLLAVRAAAHEPRIAGVVGWGVCHDLFDLYLSRSSRLEGAVTKTLLRLRASPIVNKAIAKEAKTDMLAAWALDHGQHVFAVDTPYDYVQAGRRFNTRDVSASMRQPYLGIAGCEDHLMPARHLNEQAEMLRSSTAVTATFYDKATNGHTHCQLGNLDLVLHDIQTWHLDRASAR